MYSRNHEITKWFLSVALMVGSAMLIISKVPGFSHSSGERYPTPVRQDVSGFDLAPVSLLNPPGDYCMFPPHSRNMLRPIYSRLEHELRKYSNLNHFERELYVTRCKETPDSCTFISIRAGKVYVVQSGKGFENRNQEILSLLDRVTFMFELLPDVDFAIDHDDGLQDTGYLPRLMFASFIQAPQGIMIPDFSFFDWQTSMCPGEHTRSFDDFLNNATSRVKRMEEDPLEFFFEKSDDLFWRGALLNNPKRKEQLEAIQRTSSLPVRILDLKFMEWNTDQYGGRSSSGCVSMHDHCDHRYLLHLQGNTYSSRLKYLLLCGSVVFMPQQEFEEWWYPAIPAADTAIVSNEIVIHVKSDVSDLDSKVNLFRDENGVPTERAVQTALRSLNFSMTVFSRQSVNCYWASVIIGAARAWGPILNGTRGKPLDVVLNNPNEQFSYL